jgi:hypothetical protein
MDADLSPLECHVMSVSIGKFLQRLLITPPFPIRLILSNLLQYAIASAATTGFVLERGAERAIPGY